MRFDGRTGDREQKNRKHIPVPVFRSWRHSKHKLPTSNVTKRNDTDTDTKVSKQAGTGDHFGVRRMRRHDKSRQRHTRMYRNHLLTEDAAQRRVEAQIRCKCHVCTITTGGGRHARREQDVSSERTQRCTIVIGPKVCVVNIIGPGATRRTKIDACGRSVCVCVWNI